MVLCCSNCEKSLKNGLISHCNPLQQHRLHSAMNHLPHSHSHPKWKKEDQQQQEEDQLSELMATMVFWCDAWSMRTITVCSLQ